MSSRNKTDVKKLFEFWCEVTPAHGVTSDRAVSNGATTTTPSGIIIESFPENFRDEKTIADIPVFAFPCELESDSVQSYSFVLTTDDSKWRFGFCRHDPKTDTAIVIITYLPWHDIFLRLLTVLADLRRRDLKEFKAFLTEAYNRGVPELGSNLKLFYNSGQSQFVFERPAQFQLPSILENHNLNLYYSFVEPKNMIAVFAAMLAERRIIFTSRRLDRLSSCIQAANAFLYPMVWQHIFIPVLPMKLKDYLSAPMPYLIGVPETVLETMTTDELGEVVILNCDTKIFDSPFDDVHEMPTEIITQLKKQLGHTSEHTGDRVSKIFLGVLVQLIGGYRDAVEFRDTGKTFNRDKFIESRPSHLRPFLTKMMDLQIFQQFIDERLEMLNTGLGFSDEFEMETVRYAEKMKKRSRNLAFLKNVKDKTNPAVKSAVKSVKDGSRGMKTAYKDLKSKFRDITPPNNSHFRSHLPPSSQHDHLDGSNSNSSSSGGGNGYIINGQAKTKHHSAPSSPIFNSKSSSAIVRNPKAFQYTKPEVLNGAVQSFRRAGPNPLAMSSSTTHIQSNGYTQSAHLSNHHTNHLVASPTISPASSLCSSEMNLSQELQNHPLFKTPIVDRSLKPSNSLEQQNTRTTATRTTAATLAPARPPPPVGYKLSQQQQHKKSLTLNSTPPTYYNHPYATQTLAQVQAQQVQTTAHQQPQQNGKQRKLQQHPHVETKPPTIPRLLTKSASTPNAYNTTTATATTSTLATLPTSSRMHTSTPTKHITTTDSSFDTPPDMQSPPIPPRRQSSDSISSQSTIAAMAATVSAGVQRLEQNCWQDYATRNLLQHDALRSSSSSNTSNISTASSTASASASSSSSVAALTASLSSSCDSSADSYRTATSNLSQAQLSLSQDQMQPQQQQQQNQQPPVPAPRLRKEKESLRSLQPHYLLTMGTAQQLGTTLTGSIHSVPSCSSQEGGNTANDLISLDDSHNTSFDLEDFDPLNQNARPLPLGCNKQMPNKKSTTLPIGSTLRSTTTTAATTIMSTSTNANTMKSIQNPIYQFYKPQNVNAIMKTTTVTTTTTPLQPPNCKPPPLPTSKPPPMPAPDEDFELLRKYGLDQFTLTTTATGNSAANATTATGMSNWTTFD